MLLWRNQFSDLRILSPFLQQDISPAELYLNPQAQVSSFKDTSLRESILFIDFYLKAEKIFFYNEGHENPHICRVNHFFEPSYKVGTGIGCFRLSASRQTADKLADTLADALKEKRTCTPQSRKGPKFKNVGSKTNVNHAHRRGIKSC